LKCTKNDKLHFIDNIEQLKGKDNYTLEHTDNFIKYIKNLFNYKTDKEVAFRLKDIRNDKVLVPNNKLIKKISSEHSIFITQIYKSEFSKKLLIDYVDKFGIVFLKENLKINLFTNGLTIYECEIVFTKPRKLLNFIEKYCEILDIN
jgi:hypothetical protein